MRGAEGTDVASVTLSLLRELSRSSCDAVHSRSVLLVSYFCVFFLCGCFVNFSLVLFNALFVSYFHIG